MPKDHEKQRIFTRRAFILGGVQAAALAVLAGRLAYLQFIKSDEYRALSENNHIKLVPVPAERGLLLDRVGIPIAHNDKTYRLLLDVSGMTKELYLEALAKIHKLVPIPDKKMQQLQAVRPAMAKGPLLVKENLSWEEVSLVELNSLSLPGAQVDVGQMRRYTLAEKVAHLTGYLGAASEKEMEQDNEQALLRLPDFKIGKNGIEKMLELDLRGTAGVRQMEVNVHGVVVREVGRTESVPGKNIQLTIDSRVQDIAAEKLKGQSAAVVTLDIETGNILTFVSVPAYDPNHFSQGIPSTLWKKLSDDKMVPLLNKAIGGQYPPGSTFKMMVGIAGLEKKIITPNFRVYCPGYYMLGDHRFGCWKAGGHGMVDYPQAIQHSCDTFFYTVAQRLGDAETYADVSRRCGLGQMYNLGIIGERKGIIPDAAWKRGYYKQAWTAGDTINCSIGQGYVLSTPLQLAVMIARLASGKQVMPRLIVPPGEEKPVFKPLEIDPTILQRTREGMSLVVNDPGGTAYGSRIPDTAMAFAGKTGTSQVRKLIKLGMNQNLLPWEFRHHGLFVGFAPLDKPKYATAVVVEHGGGGSSAAAPIAKEVLLKLQELEKEPSPA